MLNTGFKQADSDVTLRGVPISALFPKDITTVIIPESVSDAPPNYDPYASATTMTLNPDRTDGVVVDMTVLPKEVINSVVRDADMRRVMTREERQKRVEQIMRTLSEKQVQLQLQQTPIPAEHAVVSKVAAGLTAAGSVAARLDNGAAAVTRWGGTGASGVQPQVQPQPTEHAMNTAPQPTTPATSLFNGAHTSAQSTRPEILVTYEFANVPMVFKAYFHQVIKHGSWIILAFDKRAVGYPCNFPNDTDAQIAVQIGNSSDVYYCLTTGARFPFEEWELCLLLVEQQKA